MSGDNFADLADFRFNAKTSMADPSEEISNSRIFFCESDLLHEFLRFTPLVKKDSILIVGNGDQDHFDSRQFPKIFSTILLQNSFISDNKRIFTLPIGLENLKIGVNGIPSRFHSNKRNDVAKNTLLIGPFGDTNSERYLLGDITDQPGINLEKRMSRVPPHKYPRLLSSATWIACPRGNGTDTHRVWESLYVGSKPIVIDNPWSRSLLDFGYPLLLTTDWSTNCVYNSILNDVNISFDPKQLPILWMDFWKNWLDKKLS